MSISLPIALVLMLGAPVPDAEPGKPDAEPAPASKRVTVSFKKIAPLDPAKRSEKRGFEMNREFRPLMLKTRPDGTHYFTHGPIQSVDRKPGREAEGPGTEVPQ